MLHNKYILHRTITVPLSMLFFVISLSGCFERVDGSGQAQTQQRAIPNVRNISISSAGHLKISVAEDESLTITGDDNILALLETTLTDDTLIIAPESPEVYINPQTPLVYDIHVKSLDSLTVSGKMTVEALDVYNEDFALTSRGILDIYLKGQTQKMTLIQSGVSQLHAKDLTVDTLNVNLTGSANVDITVTGTINGALAGVSQLTYFGGPIMNIQTADYASARIGITP